MSLKYFMYKNVQNTNNSSENVPQKYITDCLICYTFSSLY